MKTHLFLTEKPWHEEMFENLKKRFSDANWIWVKKKEDFTSDKVKEINPVKIFIPHWSYYIPEEIYDRFTCIVFHMTDLPYGRGGSPLQNLISRGFKETKISAIKVVKELDAGHIYLKKDLDLSGTASDIFERAGSVMERMIEEIVEKDPTPVAQKGEVVLFQRRTPDMSAIDGISDESHLYDHIRMLDADGYPHAFLETEHLKLEFRNARWVNNQLEANVRFTKK